MTKVSTTTRRLESLVAKLQAEKQAHLVAVAEIDAVFGRFGVASTGKKRRGRPRGSKSKSAASVATRKGRRKRRKYATTGSESILQFVSRSGRKGASGADVVKLWNKEGRSGSAYKILGDLVKSKKVKRRKVIGERGSRYMAA